MNEKEYEDTKKELKKDFKKMLGYNKELIELTKKIEEEGE